jgi:hypothetical protein
MSPGRPDGDQLADAVNSLFFSLLAGNLAAFRRTRDAKPLDAGRERSPGLASETGSPRTGSSATQFGLLADFSWSVKIIDIPAG